MKKKWKDLSKEEKVVVYDMLFKVGVIAILFVYGLDILLLSLMVVYGI